MKVPFNLKIDKDVKETFSKICKNQGLTSSLVVRKMIEKYIKENETTDILK